METAEIKNVAFDAIIEKEQLSTGEDIYVASCILVPIASQGSTIEEATDNLTVALKLWMETASPEEIEANIPEAHANHQHIYRTRIEVPYGQVASVIGAEVCKILAEHGFEKVRQEGDHVSMQKKLPGTTVTAIVPLHREVARGTLGNIIRQSGLPQSIFEM